MIQNRLFSRCPAVYALLAVLLLCLGCQSSSTPPAAPPEVDQPQVSSVPLRVWVIAPVADPVVIQRQWMAGSDQPIEVRSLSVNEFLEADECACDVLLFPARLVGELVHREWIIKLADSAIIAPEASEGAELVATPRVASAQTRQGGVQYAIPLGCSLPVVVASDSLAGKIANQPISWSGVLERLQLTESADAFDDAEVDPNAMVDRFLAIAATTTTRNSKYGLLFEMQSMSPRLGEVEFVQAATVLSALSRQPQGVRATVGSHNVAWQWASSHGADAVAIASPALLDPSSCAVTSGDIIQIDFASDLQGWNTGGGLLASLTSECKQTSRALGMLRWLQQSQVRNAIAPVIEGVESSAPVSSSDSLSWKARQNLSAALATSDMPQELCLPGAEEYRAALAKELVRFIRGEKTAEKMLEDTSSAWVEITTRIGAGQRTDYEKSLGLTL